MTVAHFDYDDDDDDDDVRISDLGGEVLYGPNNVMAILPN